MMKKCLLILFGALSLTAHAEDAPESLLNEDKVWTMGYYSPYQVGRVSYVESKFEGDTIIGDVIYKRQYQRELKQGDETPQEWKATDYFVGQIGGKVYYYFKNYQHQMMIDFSASEGDMIPYSLSSMPRYIHVENVSDTIFECSTDKQQRKCIYVKDTESEVRDVWIEGIGSMKYGIEPYFMDPITGAIPQLMKCTKGDVVLFEYQEPSTNNISQPVLQEKVTGSDIFDLQGRRLKAKPSRGVYMERGKKYLTK